MSYEEIPEKFYWRRVDSIKTIERQVSILYLISDKGLVRD